MTSSSSAADSNEIINIFCNEVIGIQLSGYDNTTGISDIEDGRLSEEDDDYYILNGQKVTKPGKGIYIKNKKIIISR